MPVDYEGFLARLNNEHADAPAVLEAQQTKAIETLDQRTTGGNSGLAAKLENVAEKAIDKLDQILGVPLDQDHEQFGSILRAQGAAANTALLTQVRVDESALRQRQLDRLPALIQEVNRIAATLPPQGR